MTAVAFAADGTRLVSGDASGELRVWRLPQGDWTSFHQPSGVRALAAVPETDLLLTGGEDGTLMSWSLATGSRIHECQAHSGAVTALAILPDGRRVLTGSADARLRLWDIGSCERLADLGRHPACDDMLSEGDLISRSNVEFAYADQDQLLQYGQTRSSDGTFHGHASRINSVAVTPNGRGACSGSADGTVRLWDLETRRCVWIFGGPDTSERRAVAAVALTGRGRKVVAAAGTVHQWRLSPYRRSWWLWGVLPDAGTPVTEERADLMLMLKNALVLVDRFERRVRVGSRSRRQSFSLSATPRSVAAAPAHIAVGCEDGSIWLYTLDAREPTGEKKE